MRRVVLTLIAAVSLVSLAACGSSKLGYGDPTSPGWKDVTISGDFGKAIEVSTSKELAYPEDADTKVLVEGTGDALTAQDTAEVQYTFYDGTTQQVSICTYSTDADSSASPSADASATTCSGQSDSWTLDGKSVPQGLVDLLIGQKVGSRVASILSSDDAFGDSGLANYGIGTRDALVIVIDVISASPTPAASESPSASASPSDEPTEQAPTEVDPATLPKIVGGDSVTGLDFTGLTEPADPAPFEIAYVTKGTGAPVAAGANVTVNYYGSLWGATSPFDSSFSRGQTASFGLDEVIKGWTWGLQGVPVGSRVILQIPGDLGYPDGSSDGSIPAGATLYFVVDLVSAQ